jgi:hypothetical protein
LKPSTEEFPSEADLFFAQNLINHKLARAVWEFENGQRKISYACMPIFITVVVVEAIF